jgi:hypothetical protein
LPLDLGEGTIYKLAVLLAATVAVAGCNFRGGCGQKPGIISEDIKGNGDNWDADFKARVPAPVKDVFGVMEKVENAKSDQILNVKVLSTQGNSQNVEIDFAGPTGASVPTQFAFQYFADQNRITYKSLNSDIFETEGDCQLNAECTATLVDCRQATKLLQQRPLTDGVIKENIRQLFLAEIDSLHRALHVEIPDQSDEGDDAP